MVGGSVATSDTRSSNADARRERGTRATRSFPGRVLRIGQPSPRLPLDAEADSSEKGPMIERPPSRPIAAWQSVAGDRSRSSAVDLAAQMIAGTRPIPRTLFRTGSHTRVNAGG